MSEKPYKFYNATQVSGQLSDTWSPAKGVELHEVRLTTSEIMNPTSTLIIQLDSGQDPVYDAKFIRQSISGEYGYVVGYAPPKVFRTDDALGFTTTNAPANTTYGLELVYKEI